MSRNGLTKALLGRSSRGLLFSRLKKAPVAMLSVLFCFISQPLIAQICESDGISVDFLRDNGSVVEVKGIKPKDMVGRNFGNFSSDLGSGNVNSLSMNQGLISVGLDSANGFSNTDISAASFDRKEPNVWEVSFPRGLYEFRNKNNLEVEVLITALGGHAVHVSEGSLSTVSLSVDVGKIHEQWWGGSNSLKSLRGDLDLHFFDLQNLSYAGNHRATLHMCVNIKGYL